MPDTAVTIGTFDGVHRGHTGVIRRARELVGPEGRVIAMSFDPHPLEILRPARAPARLTTFARRAELLRRAGADEVYRLEPAPDLLSMKPEVFLSHLRDAFQPRWVVEGDDFHFGRGRSGTLAQLTKIGEDLGFEVAVVPGAEIVLGDQTIQRASSSLARLMLAMGRVEDTAEVLGRPYQLVGEVAPGDRLGRAIGFPTVNLQPDTVAPGDGVYAGLATLPDGRRIPAALHIGGRPTVGGVARRVEAHLLGLETSWSAGRPPRDGSSNGAPHPWRAIEGLPEYGWRCRIAFLTWLRDPMRFGSPAELAAQLARDCARTAALADALPEFADLHPAGAIT